MCLWTYPQINNLVVGIAESGKNKVCFPQFSPFKKGWMLQFLRSHLLFFCVWLEADHLPCSLIARAARLSLFYQCPRGEMIQHITCFFQRANIKSLSWSAQTSFQLACSKSSACNTLLLLEGSAVLVLARDTFIHAIRGRKRRVKDPRERRRPKTCFFCQANSSGPFPPTPVHAWEALGKDMVVKWVTELGSEGRLVRAVLVSVCYRLHD